MIQTQEYQTSRKEIAEDKMNVTVTNYHPQYKRQQKEMIKREISARLYRIFVK